jgi:hypothetical protein
VSAYRRIGVSACGSAVALNRFQTASRKDTQRYAEGTAQYFKYASHFRSVTILSHVAPRSISIKSSETFGVGDPEKCKKGDRVLFSLNPRNPRF